MQSHSMFTYKSNDGKSVSHASCLSDLIKRYQDHPDYQAIQDDTQLGVAEIQGRRPEQEDRAVLGVLPDYSQLISSDEYKSILTDTTAILQESVCKLVNAATQGSTMCATLIDGRYIYTANLGDSTAFLCVIDAYSKVKGIGIGKQFNQLNPILHNPSIKSERERIRSVKGKISDNRLDSDDHICSLAVSRSLGDQSYEKSGLSHEPDVYMDMASIPYGGKAFVIVACDGLTEGNQLKLSDIQQLIEKNQDLPTDQIAKLLTAAAFNAGSGDNISVAVTSINMNDKRRKYMAIFDGHGGADVAEVASILFDKVLILKMQQLALRKLLDNTTSDAFYKEALSDLLGVIEYIPKQLLTWVMVSGDGFRATDFVGRRYQDYSDRLGEIITAIANQNQIDIFSKINSFIDHVSNMQDLCRIARIIHDGCKETHTKNDKFRELSCVAEDINIFFDGKSPYSSADLILNVSLRLQKLKDSLKYISFVGKLSSLFQSDNKLKPDLEAIFNRLDPLVNNHLPHDMISPSDSIRSTP